MRTATRNKQAVYWANYDYTTPIIDSSGNETSESNVYYTIPQKAMWSVSYVDSDTETEMFGTRAVDTIRIVPDKRDFMLTETSILWVGITPSTSYNPTAPHHNYRIAGIRPSLNEIVVYAQKV